MSIVTNTITRYATPNPIREDLADAIYNISPTETPVMTALKRGKAENTYTEWQTDDLAAAVTTNAQLDGDDVPTTTDSRSDTVRVGNYTQISRKLITVSGTADAVRRAGMKSAMAYEMAKAGKEIKRDIEATILTTQVANAGNSTVARKSASLPNWIVTNWTGGGGTTAARPQMSSGTASTDLGGYPATTAVAGTTITFTETILKSMMQQIWTQGGDPSTVWVGPVNKAVCSTFSGIATRYKDVPGMKQASIIGAADIYVGDFGQVTIVADRFTTESIVLMGDPQYAEMAYLRPMSTERMAKTGDATKNMLICEWTLKVRAQKAFAAKWAATTS